MRIWDVSPAYLNRQSLLGEHRELHGLVSVLINNKKGYSRHPETLRWVDHGWAITMRHRMIAEEMALRGYKDRTPVLIGNNKEGVFPAIYIDNPYNQFKILESKYVDKEQGRLPLPKNAQQIWAQHKYSIMARDVNLYKILGQTVSAMKSTDDFSELVDLLYDKMKIIPNTGGVTNALQHMWGYISEQVEEDIGRNITNCSLRELLQHIQCYALSTKKAYLINSVSLSELGVWI